MHQSLDRRQPSARFRAQLREIPLQRRYGTGAPARELPPRARDEGRTDDPLTAEIAAATGPEVLEEHGPDLVDRGLPGAEAPEDVEPPAAPGAQPLDGVG